MWNAIRDVLLFAAQIAAMGAVIVLVIVYVLKPVTTESMASEDKPLEDS